MLHFSKDEDYAVILANVLAKNYKKRLVPLSEIAEEYKLSLFYLRNLANKLIHTGLIKAVEGKKGGYFLTKAPQLIKIGEIIAVFNKKKILACCSVGDKKGPCKRAAFCETGHIWKKLNEEFYSRIANLSLTEFMEEKK